MEIAPLRISSPVLPHRFTRHLRPISLPRFAQFPIHHAVAYRNRRSQHKQQSSIVGEKDDELGFSEALTSTETVLIDENKEAEEEEEEYVSTSSSTFLSLSNKPDRNMALLDDYEAEELETDVDPNHRSGYVAVLGKPNVGKSTIANQMIGQKLSIVTDKPQTTRHRVLGICSGADYQVVLYDTPGVIEKKMHKLDTMMMNNVRSAALNADCVLVLVDATKMPQKIDEVLGEGIGHLQEKPPVLLVLNKKDLIKPGEIAKKIEVCTLTIEMSTGAGPQGFRILNKWRDPCQSSVDKF